jgi:hypothetical protein
MTQKDQVLVVDVVVAIDPTQDTMASSLISQPACAIAKLSTIINIHKYKRFHERYHFISMAMEVHNTPRCDLDRFMRECAHFFDNKWSKSHLCLFFCIQFFRQHVNIIFQHVLASITKKKDYIGEWCLF